MSKRKPRLPVLHPAFQAGRGEVDPVESALRVLEAKGCDREKLRKYVKRVRDVKEIRLRLPLPNYSRELKSIDRAEQAVSKLLRDKLVWGLFQRPSPLLPPK